ncbi:CusA/CzcA family heavy metal efflux RND transporter [uncultured Nevskia sp.]|uniref:efflux RND transporter permease subunit n=1 Tax=uncultured Nevskia sp. TaxID=228950 RepID=UPI0025D73A91|nr:CusA/CzcA family heavy metal efflux RND transporter [uncultured Nevskia sp.]
MIATIIRWSISNRVLVLMVTAVLALWGTRAALTTPLDAIPDLSDTQVIIRTSWPGQAPQVVEDQVTYPLTTTMLSVPGARTVRGYSMFGDSFVYVIFDDATDLYWARSRVLEYLNQVSGRLPPAARPTLGPDATGVGWIYEYALVDRSNRLDISQLRAIQDWFLKYELKSVENVAEVASVGGLVKQYQIVLDPDRLRATGTTISTVIDAVRASNNEAGGSVLELGEVEYAVRASGYLKTLDDFRAIPVGLGAAGVPVLLGDVARVQIGPELRRGVSELDGQGEAVGGIIVMRSGKNALATIRAVRAKLESLKPGLPVGVEIVPTYDRSELILNSVGTLKTRLIEEMIVVAAVCALFLFHLRSALVAIVSLPLGILAAFAVMKVQGLNANIMSLGGIAIAIGAMVDAAVVMIENAHKHLEHAGRSEALSFEERAKIITASAVEVGPALFFCLLIITLSFVPVFTLEAQEGKLFGPLALTKTYAMAAAAGLSVTLIPVLMLLFIRGRIPDEQRNPLNRLLIAVYRPALAFVLRHPVATLVASGLLMLSALIPIARLGTEFMPPLIEGDLLYMPSALPGLSADKASQLMQQTDRLIMQFPEVERVFGKAGRAESATDPAGLEMFETTIRFKPRKAWPDAGKSQDALIDELNTALAIPGLANLWVQPIRNRIDMLSTGIKSPVGVKIAGADLKVIEQIGTQIETLLKDVPGTRSVYAERVRGGRYIDVRPDRLKAARLGLSIADVQQVVTLAIGGENIGETIEGRQRFPINLRYPRELRDSVAALRVLPIVTKAGATITLGEIAEIAISDGPPQLKSENARLNGWVYVDISGRDLGGYVHDAQALVAAQLKLPAGYSVAWSGQFEYLQRAEKRLQLVVPFTLFIILILLYLTFRAFLPALLIMASLPFALVGGLWLLLALGYNLSIASAVGFIALAGVAAEFGVIMLIYLDQAIARRGASLTRASLIEAIEEGAVLRVRPKAMTVAVIVAGLLPILIGGGTGSEVMRRIAAPMVGGMISAPLLSLFVLPAAYLLLRRRRLAA